MTKALPNRWIMHGASVLCQNRSIWGVIAIAMGKDRHSTLCQILIKHRNFDSLCSHIIADGEI